MERHGFIRDILDVKVLILFVMARIDAPADADTIYALCFQDDCLSYFDVKEALPQLVQSGHLEEHNGRYSITEKGRAPWRRHGRLDRLSGFAAGKGGCRSPQSGDAPYRAYPCRHHRARPQRDFHSYDAFRRHRGSYAPGAGSAESQAGAAVGPCISDAGRCYLRQGSARSFRGTG